jgi:hypothetical protein
MAVAACDRSPTDSESIDLAITLDQPTYSLSSDQAAEVTLTNNSSTAVHIPIGESVYFERLSNGKWVDAQPWFVVDGLARSWALNPGGRIVERLPFAYLRGPGTYRFYFRVGMDPDLKRFVPMSLTVSPEFEVQP